MCPNLPLVLPVDGEIETEIMRRRGGPGQRHGAAVVEMLLKDSSRLNRLLRSETHQRELVAGLLAIAMVGLGIHGIAMTAIIDALFAKYGFWLGHLPAAHWNDLSAANLTFSYTLGAIAANGICLPSFYFYGLLAGVRISFVGATGHALKGLAAGSVALVGLLPIYLALALSAVVFPFSPFWTRYVVVMGLLVLPCVAGLAGMANLYEGFVGLADTMPSNRSAVAAMFSQAADAGLGFLRDLRRAGGHLLNLASARRLDAISGILAMREREIAELGTAGGEHHGTHRNIDLLSVRGRDGCGGRFFRPTSDHAFGRPGFCC